MLFPTLQEVLRLSEAYPVIPVFWEIPADHLSPLRIYAALSRQYSHAFLLEGIGTPTHFHRWSYIGCNPELVFHLSDGQSDVTAHGRTIAVGKHNTQQIAEDILIEGQSPAFPDKPEFTGGFAGFCLPMEPLSCVFGLYDEVIAYDHLHSTAVIILNLHTGCDITAQYQAAEIRAAQLAAQMEDACLEPQYRDDAPPIRAASCGSLTEVENAPDSFELYRRMRSHFPSPHLCFFREDAQRFAGICSSDALGKARCGFRGYGGRVYEIFAETAVHYPDAAACQAVIDCKNPEEILTLMRSAKLENTKA